MHYAILGEDGHPRQEETEEILEMVQKVEALDSRSGGGDE
jgi:hypothetical protein